MNDDELFKYIARIEYQGTKQISLCVNNGVLVQFDTPFQYVYTQRRPSGESILTIRPSSRLKLAMRATQNACAAHRVTEHMQPLIFTARLAVYLWSSAF
jgi:hypothetical protein